MISKIIVDYLIKSDYLTFCSTETVIAWLGDIFFGGLIWYGSTDLPWVSHAAGRLFGCREEVQQLADDWHPMQRGTYGQHTGCNINHTPLRCQ